MRLGREVHVRDAFRVCQQETRPQRRRSFRRASVVVTIRVDPLVWALALDTADGDVGRIEVLSATTVVVHNTAGKRRRGR